MKRLIVSTRETTQETDTLSNENVSVTLTRSPNCSVKMEIAISPEAAEAAYGRAFKNVKKEVSIPGFRKGKAPDTFIRNKYASAIEQEWKDIVLETGFNEALELTATYPMKNGMIKRPVIHEISREKGVKFGIEFEIKPTIPSIDL